MQLIPESKENMEKQASVFKTLMRKCKCKKSQCKNGKCICCSSKSNCSAFCECENCCNPFATEVQKANEESDSGEETEEELEEITGNEEPGASDEDIDTDTKYWKVMNKNILTSYEQKAVGRGGVDKWLCHAQFIASDRSSPITCLHVASTGNYIGQPCRLNCYGRKNLKYPWVQRCILRFYNFSSSGSWTDGRTDLLGRFKTISLWLLMWFYYSLWRETCVFVTFYKSITDVPSDGHSLL